MALESNKDAQLIPVQQRSKFMQDCAFCPTRDSIKKEGSHVVQEILKTPTENAVCTNMDQAFFHNERFELIVDARGYAPQDIQCAVTQENIEVKATTTQKEGNKERTTSMTRSYQLPKNVVPERGTCNLSSDGILVISVPWRD